jgi:anti-sigma B factor antagonist
VNLSITIEERDGLDIVHAGGDLDVYTAPQLRAALDQIGLTEGTIVLDLSEVHFIDSTALGMLVAARQESRENAGEIRLVMDDPYLLKIFRITGFDGLFSIYPDIAGAITAV